MNTSPTPVQARTNRRMLYLLIVVFFGPLAAAFALYYGSSWRPASQSNHGELYHPARPLPAGLAVVRQGDWSLLYVGDAACETDACRQTLVFQRQVRLMLGQEMDRVRRVLLATDHCCANDYLQTEHAGLVVLDAGAPEVAGALQVIPARDREHSLYVVDPLGNLVMRYDARQDPKGLLSDLKKLLKLSHIG